MVCDGVQGRESLKLGLCGEEDDLGAGNDEAEGKWDWRFPESENDAVWGVRRRPLENWTKVTGVDRADVSTPFLPSFPLPSFFPRPAKPPP